MPRLRLRLVQHGVGAWAQRVGLGGAVTALRVKILHGDEALQKEDVLAMNHAQKALFEGFSRPPKVGVQQLFFYAVCSAVGPLQAIG